MPAGRPTSYRKKYCEAIMEYFEKPLRELKSREVASAGQILTVHNEEPVDLPTIAGFGASIGISKDTIYKWEKKHPEFADALSICRGIQEKIMITHALKGDYHAGFTKFLLMNNHGYKDKTEHEVTGEGLTINYEKA